MFIISSFKTHNSARISYPGKFILKIQTLILARNKIIISTW